jgi:hypothetical protein
MGAQLSADESILILAVEGDDTVTFGQHCTPGVQAAIPRAVDAVLSALDETERRLP